MSRTVIPETSAGIVWAALGVILGLDPRAECCLFISRPLLAITCTLVCFHLRSCACGRSGTCCCYRCCCCCCCGSGCAKPQRKPGIKRVVPDIAAHTARMHTHLCQHACSLFTPHHTDAGIRPRKHKVGGKRATAHGVIASTILHVTRSQASRQVRVHVRVWKEGWGSAWKRQNAHDALNPSKGSVQHRALWLLTDPPMIRVSFGTYTYGRHTTRQGGVIRSSGEMGLWPKGCGSPVCVSSAATPSTDTSTMHHATGPATTCAAPVRLRLP